MHRIAVHAFVLYVLVVQVAAEYRCFSQKGDIGIALDATCESGAEFEKIISSLKKMVTAFKVSEHGKHFSFMTYGEYPRLKNVFADERYYSPKAYLELLDETRCTQNSTRRLDLAFITAKNMFSNGGGMRKNVRRTLLLITTGKQSICDQCSNSIMKILPKLLQETKVHVVVVSIGNHESIKVLKPLAGKDDHFLEYDDIDSFVSAQENMDDLVCTASQVPGGCSPEIMMGLVIDYAPKSCKEILKLHSSADSGVYWINPSGTQPMQIYCDMKMSGGGWTLVYSYTFTNYAGFMQGTNAVTPQPTWPTRGNVRRSSTPPLGETHYAAMVFSWWKNIGHEWIIKSNINHWIQCKEGTGSLVNWKTGTISCHVIKNVADKCHNVAPDTLEFRTSGDGKTVLGADFKRSKSTSSLKEYYYLETSTKTRNWPTHDPCGTNGLNHVKGVANPHGNIFIR